MHGAQKVIFFCGMVALLPVILILLPLYLRHNVFSDLHYPVAESDILEMPNGISSVFCQEHVLKMNIPFSAFAAKGRPDISRNVTKHVRLKKVMSLPDDTLEYWGFFLPASSAVLLSVCSRYEGSRILVVRGEKNLRDCGLMQPTKLPEHNIDGNGLIQVTHEFTGEPEDRNEGLDSAQNMEEDLTLSEERKKREVTFDERKKELEELLNGSSHNARNKRQAPAYKLDGGIAHGGNAINYSEANESSVSSFENSLLTCYDGHILLSESFPPSEQCNGTKYLETGQHLHTIHNVTSDGYYYYIFYSDNDYVQNDIYAIFDIHKPTYLHGNYSVGCINKTVCSFPIKFGSRDNVVVEVPTRDGIENENDDITVLTSICRPRKSVYAIFPVSVLVVILVFSFV